MTINRIVGGHFVLFCLFVQVNDWDATNPTEGAGMVAAAGRNTVRTFFERITKDIEIVRVALLLTGCIQVR